jgi:hypothetical protein
LRTALSGIHRFGVYALEDIPAGRIVIEYTGKRMSWAKASRVPFEKSIYIADLKRGFAIDGRIGGSGAEYVNHSCEPNLKPKRSRGHLFFCRPAEHPVRRRANHGLQISHKIATHTLPLRCPQLPEDIYGGSRKIISTSRWRSSICSTTMKRSSYIRCSEIFSRPKFRRPRKSQN